MQIRFISKMYSKQLLRDFINRITTEVNCIFYRLLIEYSAITQV